VQINIGQSFEICIEINIKLTLTKNQPELNDQRTKHNYK